MNKVLWKNGTFLAPQHFQQADRYLESLLRSHDPLAWGVIHLQLDEAALGQGRFGVLRCRAVLPDGTAVHMGPEGERLASDCRPPAAPAQFPPGAERTDAYLTLPERLNRFTDRMLEVIDDFDPRNRRSILVGDKNLGLAFAGQSLAGLVSLKLAELERSSAGVLVPRADFIPAAMTLGAAPWFSRTIDRLVTQIETRLHEVAGLPRRAGDDALLYQTLCQALPVLRHLQDREVQQSTHPSALYAELLRLCGGLAVLSADFTALPRYEHADLTTCFHALEARLRKLLGQTVPGRVDTVELRPRPGFEDFVLWDGVLPGRPGPGRQVFLELSGPFSFQEFVAEIPGRAKLGGTRALDRALEGGWPGLPFEFVPAPRMLADAPPNAIFFRLPSERYPLIENGILENDRLFTLWEELRETGRTSFYAPQIFLRERRPRVRVHLLSEGGAP